MQSVSVEARTSLRQDHVLAPMAATPESSQPSFLLLALVLSAIVVLLGVSIINVLLDYVNKTVESEVLPKKKKAPSLNAYGKEMWSDDDDDTSTVADPRETSVDLTMILLSRPPPGWRPLRSCLINSY